MRDISVTLACRTGGVAGSSARTKRENEREARGEKNPSAVTLLLMLYRPLEMIGMKE